MTRVDDNREAQRAAEARRADEANKQKKQGNAEEFRKLVAEQKQAAQQGARKLQAKSGERQASNALLARQGIKSRNFSQALQSFGRGQVSKNANNNEARRSELNDNQLDTDERQSKTDRQADNLADKLAPISRDDGQEGSLSGGGGGSSDHNDGFDGSGIGQATGLGETSMAAGAQAAQGAHAPQLPPEVLQQLVNRVFAGVTPEGLSQFTVELRGDVLGGARLDVVAKDGKITCTFHTDDKNTARLLKASEGQLARAFARKGMTLDRLAVEQR